MLWLILVYWEGLGLEMNAQAGARRLPISAAAWVLGIVAVPAAVLAIGPSRAATALAGAGSHLRRHRLERSRRPLGRRRRR